MSKTECKLYLGPMYSEKSSELIRLVKRATLADFKCLVIKFEEDNRYGNDNSIYTHDGVKLSEGNLVKVVKASKLEDVQIGDEDVIAIDEGQFYPDLPEYVEKWMAMRKKIYIVALNGDFRKKPFGRIGEIIPLCTFITKLSGICMICKKNNSSYSKRIVDDNSTKLIGSKETYATVCYDCF